MTATTERPVVDVRTPSPSTTFGRGRGAAVVSDRDELDNGTLLELSAEMYGTLKIEARSSAGEVFIGVV